MLNSLNNGLLHTVSHTVFSSLAIFFSSIRFSSCNFSLTHCYTHSFSILSKIKLSLLLSFIFSFLFFSFLSFFSLSLFFSLFVSSQNDTIRVNFEKKNEASSFTISVRYFGNSRDIYLFSSLWVRIWICLDCWYRTEEARGSLRI